MNNIYKVIWSKAKNCYVVASEIARSHTKSASGSEKIGGVTRRSLLASLMALSLLCGGLGVASAANSTVHVDEAASGAAEVYTKTGVDTLLADYGRKTDVENNKNNIAALQTTTTDHGQKITANTTQIANNTAAIEKKFDKETAEAQLALKANALDVYSKTDADTTFATKEALNAKADTAALADKANTDLSNLTEAGKTAIKTTMTDELAKKADKTVVTALVGRVGNLETTVSDPSNGLVKKVADLNKKTTKIGYDAANDITSVNGMKVGQQVDMGGKNLTNVGTINGIKLGTNEGGNYITQDGSIWGNMKNVDTQVKTNADAIGDNTTAITELETKVGAVGTGEYLDHTKSIGENLERLDAGLKQEVDDRTAADNDLSDRIGTVTDDGEYIKKSATNNVSDNLKVLDARAKTNADAIAQEKTDRENAIGSLTENKNYIKKANNVSDNLVELDKQAKTNADAITETNQRTHGITRNDIRKETSIEGKVTVDTDGNIKAEGTITSKGLDAGTGEIKTGGKVSAGDVSTGTLETTGNATIGGNLDVQGTLNTKDVTAETIHISKSEDKPDYKSEGSIVGEGGNLSVYNEKFYKSTNITEKSVLHVDEKGTVNWATSEDATGNKTEGRSEVAADHIKNSVKKTEGGTTFGYEENITETGKVGTATDKDGNRNELTQTATGTENTVTSKDGNRSTTKQEAGSISSTVYDKDGNVKASSEMKEDGSIFNNATGDMTNTVGGQLKTTVTGQATEEFKNGLDTTVNGTEKHTVNGKQINTVTEGQENNISGGQINNILTGNQETTVSNGSIINKADNGDISNTAKNVTNEGTESVTNKVGANEVKVSSTDGVDIKAEAGKKITESVGTASRVVENDKITDTAGNSTVTTENGKGTTFGNGSTGTTNIYGDSINTGTIKAKDTTTDKLTAGAAAGVDGGRLTVDANDGVKGSYKYGDYTSKSYILPNTLMSGVDNGKDITDTGFVGSRTDHYMDDDKAKLNETVKDADGSNVTKKTSTKTYTEIKDTNGNTLSVNQKADGNNYKLEDQDGNTNHVTNSATQSKQTLKDKVGNTLTTNQTATKNNFDLKSADGSKENHTTNTVDESRVAIKGENGKAELSTTDEGTTFKHSAAKEAFTEGGATNTTIKGNTITTGKVTMDYADVMKDLGVHGNATVDKDMTVKGNTTLGEAGKDTTLTVNSKATFNNGLTVTNGETKLKNTTIEGTLNVFENATFQKDVTANSFSVNGKTYIDSDGLNANNQVIRNVADGSISEGSKDAVNGGQLYQVKNDLEGKVNKVGANAAAMANLHPMEFDPDSKWNIAAAIGNYGSETAAALGAFYRPNDDVMVNLSTAFGTGENMVGGGVSVRLGKSGNKLSREESNALKAQVDDLTARMDALLSVLNPNMSKDFPDVPENHWAYEAVSRLAGNDIVQGYPDGEFHGERTMTRYEMAEIIYNALSRGAEAERELVEEFKPELQAMAASEKATAEKAEG